MEQDQLPGDPHRVLIVDDSATEIRATILTLRQWGYRVDHVTDGTHAIEAVLAAEYSCILVDLRMAALGGEALIDYWSMEAPELLSRVIVTTGFHAAASRLEGRVCDILLKPYKKRELELSVGRCVGGGSDEQPDGIRRAQQVSGGK